MAAGEKTDEDAFDNIVLADNNFGYLTPYGAETFDCLLKGRFGCHLLIVEQTRGQNWTSQDRKLRLALCGPGAVIRRRWPQASEAVPACSPKWQTKISRTIAISTN